MRPILIVILSLAFLSGTAQSRFTISGTVRSKAKGESLIGVTLSAGSGTATSNSYGFYSITLPAGSQVISLTSIGFQSKRIELELTKDTVMNIFLEDEASGLEEVVVTAQSNRRSLTSPQMGLEKLSTKEIKNVPVLMGERDLLKSIQLLPGIKSGGDGNSGFFVRGGAADQNLILLDEAPVYNASHLLGFFSTFNSDAIKDVSVFKGGMPAQYGGRLSSVLDLKMNDGNNQGYNVSGGIGVISSRLNIEGPIQKDKSSFLVSGRRTYADLFTKLSKDTVARDNKLYFYDLNAKVNYELGPKDKLYVSGYFGADKLGAGDNFELIWGNATGTLRWNHIFNKKLFSNTSLIFSNYNYEIKLKTGANDVSIFSQIRDYNFKEELQWYLNDKNNIRFGVNAIYHTMTPGDVKSSATSSYNSVFLQKRYSLENAAYVANTWKASNRLNVSYGVRFTAFSILGKGDFYNIDPTGKVIDTMRYDKGDFVKTYFNLEPRVAGSYKINDRTSVKASYVRNVQNLHLISNSAAGNPTDRWVASTNIIKPEISDQFSVGYYQNFNGNNYEFSTEAYYKSLENQVDYKDGANIFNNSNAIETELLFGTGRAYGLENMVRKRTGKLTGWISYTISKTERKIAGINGGRWYNARQDRTHDVAIVAMYEMNKKWNFSATWVYYTGDAVSFPSGKYMVDNQVYFYYTERNGYRMPDYHRLDIGATVQLKKRKKMTSELAFSLYNAYGRRNAYSITFREKKDDPSKTEAVKLSLFRFIPSVTYNFKF